MSKPGTKSGDRFGKLVVVDGPIGKTKHRSLLWRARCDCGATVVVPTGDMKSGNTASCGSKSCRQWSHGMARSPEYQAWTDMKARCQNPNLPNYDNYGGRGITVCKEWCESFQAFFESVGPRPS